MDIPYLPDMEYLPFMKGKSWLFFLIIPFPLSLFSSCGECSKKIDCPAYNDAVLDRFFPYQDNQQLLFRSSVNEQQLVTLKNVETSEPYQAIGGPYGGSPTCRSMKRFASVESDTAGRTLFGVVLENEGDYRRSAAFGIRLNRITFELWKDTGIARIEINGFPAFLATQYNVTFSNRTYSKMITATQDTTAIKQAGIYQVYYAEAEGLLGYREYPSLKTWIKQ